MELLKQNAKIPAEHEITETDENLYSEFIDKSLNEDYVNMVEFRMKLPAYQSKQEIINLMEANQVILIEGSTGCGKTTQIPQYALDEALMNKNGKRTKILCTQPRRIAGKSCDFNVSKISSSSSLFCP
jgi:HrpA-like RNA helicase